MLKISDPDYFLPHVQAFEAGRTLTSGRTRPMLMRGVCTQNGEKGDWVVKLKGSPEMSADACMNELLASFIATELSLHIPDCAVIDISEELVETMPLHSNYLLAQQSIGLNFGSKYREGYSEIVAGQAIPESIRTLLYELFAFDILIGNPDRRTTKPNFLSNGRNVLIYDHELAFSFTKLLPFARNPQPWLIPEPDMEWISNHFCFNILRKNSFDYSNFISRLALLQDEFWKKAEELIPPEWKTSNFSVIKAHISSIVTNQAIFSQELNRILSA